MTKHFTKDAFVRLEAQMNKKKTKDESSDTDSLPEINQEIICSICLEEVLTEYLWLSCGHCFHRRCIVNWKKKKQNCPNCRSVQQYNCTLIRFLFTGKIAERINGRIIVFIAVWVSAEINVTHLLFVFLDFYLYTTYT